MLYDLGITLFGLAIRLHALFNAKSQAWIDGRKDVWNQLENWTRPTSKVIWCHTSSLGEFEQALPVLQALKTADPSLSLVVSFFSPSGYEQRKNHPIADLIFYLPLDTESNAKRLIDIIQPDVAVMTKYDLWKNHLEAAKATGIKLVLFAARFTPEQYFFKVYGGVGRAMLKLFDAIHVQGTQSQKLLNSIGIQSEISGDTRYDRVMAHVDVAEVPATIQNFCVDSRVLVAGSSWPEGEQMLADSRENWPDDLKLIIAPHDISENHISAIQRLFPDAVRFSKLDSGESQILIIDNIGLLSSLYKIADVAYIGGAFGQGLHNILEATAFGVPVIYGNRTHGHPESDDMEAEEFAIKLESPVGFSSALNHWLNEDKTSLRPKIQTYMTSKTGATDMVTEAIHEALGITTESAN